MKERDHISPQDDTLLNDILSELSTLSADEWAAALAEDPETGSAAGGGRAPESYSIDQIYGFAEEEISGRIDEMISDGELDAAVTAHMASDAPLENDLVPAAGVIKDELVLSLLREEIVNITQVFDALRLREDGEDLWRVLCRLESTDPERIREAAAAHAGYALESFIGARPTVTLMDRIQQALQREDIVRMIEAGLVPIDQIAQGGLLLASSDPTSSAAQTALLGAPLEVVCVYTPEAELAEALENVRAYFRIEEDAPEGEIAPEPAAPIEIKPVSATDVQKRVSKDRVVKALVAENLVTEEQVAEAAAIHAAEAGRDALWRVLADLPSVDRPTVYGKAAAVYAFKQETLVPGRPDHDFVRLTMETLAEHHREEMLEMLLLPFEHALDFDTGTGRMVFVTPDPTRPDVNKLLHSLDVGRFELRYAPETDIVRLLDELFPRKNEYLERITQDTQAFDLGMSYEETEDVLDEEALEAEMSRSKLINLFEAALMESVRRNASDIHIYPNQNRAVEIHFRTDGRLKKWHTEEKVHPEAFLAVVKDNSTNVDRFERDMAQDGFIQREIDGALIRFRVSILPIATANQEIRAESIVIRILDDRKVLTDIRKLGMLDVALERFNRAIRQPHGMVILTGPTGSGKSTTLVAALHQVVTPEVNVLTVEDPVEYIIKGVRQIKLSHKLDLEGALRAILRHDPDVVMVGEMRDRQTAELAIKLANTGHLTFSTLHTNDAPAAVSRLYKMGIEPFLIAYAINLVVAQRLIREVCSDCRKVDHDPDLVLLRSLGFTEDDIAGTTFYQAAHGGKCQKCGGNGYKGRRAVCETLYFSREIRQEIAESAEAIDEDRIRQLAVKEGMLTLQDSARELVKMGATTVEEMLRVTATA
ncbi:MAG: GspE/PulE family protein [Rhodothermales bacterium]